MFDNITIKMAIVNGNDYNGDYAFLYEKHYLVMLVITFLALNAT